MFIGCVSIFKFIYLIIVLLCYFLMFYILNNVNRKIDLILLIVYLVEDYLSSYIRN